ncbi:hypothetical protein PYW07_014589 [Mythimna separata]|uniref:Uncharacterized protein n=1 Tax=Mythimna separata TaxID=271217 RepID=A0AAD7Z0W1_MYTSE|nr:hypothetical protein PYW07_014589 [Mythimna separata]
MGSNTQFIYYSQECRDKGPLSCCSKKKEPEVRNFDSRRVTKGILNEILGEMYKVNYEKPLRPTRIIKIPRVVTPKHTHRRKTPLAKKESIPLSTTCSMTGLIIWNIRKAIQMRPCLDLKEFLEVAEQRLNSDAPDICDLSDQDPELQHLLCALLAWHQMGHHHADSLYKFVIPKIKEKSCAKPNINRNSVIWKKMTPADNGTFGSHTTGPIVALPVETRVIMRADNAGPCSRPTSPCTRPAHTCTRPAHTCTRPAHTSSRPAHTCSRPATLPPSTRLAQDEITHDKLDAAFDLNASCNETLATLEESINELRERAHQLAQQEGTRVKLLERAEGAWADLEKGYQKKIDGEKETLRKLEAKIKSTMEERKTCKANCKSKTSALARRKEDAETLKKKLNEVENKVYTLATKKLQVSEEAARTEAALAEELAMVMQYERDLKFDEDQTRRKFESLMNESDSTRALACETERAMRAELAALRDQIQKISKQLLDKDEQISKIKNDHGKLRSEKKELIDDLESCKSSCDKKMQSLLDELKSKKKKLLDLQEQVLECRCKVPIDTGVQVKRTSSMVAMCRCAPEDNLLESCSCTSLRSNLLSNLLADLFGGLQAELGSAGSQMPCQMLKCLEDRHSWDRPSVIKTNLRNYFSKLLKKELDIAIATSIESYHARWVGRSCADAPKIKPTLEDDLEEGWQQRAIERRAQQLANKLAGDLINEKTEAGPCECTGSSTKKPSDTTALFPCLMPLNSAFHRATTTTTVYRQAGETSAPYWDRTIQDVTQLKLQIEDLKKDAIKKEDLKVMEENIFKIVREASVLENEYPLATTRDTSNFNGESEKKEVKNSRVESRDHSPKTSNQNKFGTTKKKDTKDEASTAAKINDDVHTCEAEIIVENVDDLVLKCSLENVDLAHDASTTADVESSSLETGYSNSDFFPVGWIKSPLPVVSGRSHAVKLTNSIYFPGVPIDDESFISGTTTDFDIQKNSECCVCDKVPICHVKMLVEHIEKNLVECKCTCDSLISKVCPIHAKRDS